MNIGIIGAAGNLGRRLTAKAADHGHEVTAFVHRTPVSDGRVTNVSKGLFELTPEDLNGLDLLYSTYGSGFEADPEVNRRAIHHLAEITAGAEVRLILVGGAGCLYTDEGETVQAWELPGHPLFLKGISRNLALGLSDLKRSAANHWLFVCPALWLDADGPETGDCMIFTDGHVHVNEDGESYLSYGDLAQVMLELGETPRAGGQVITAVSRHGGRKNL